MRKVKSKQLALLLVFALMAGMVSGHPAQASKKKPRFSVKKVSVKKGKTKKISVKNGKGYKLSWKVKNKKIATLKKVGKYARKVKGKKEGKTTVICIAKKGAKKYRLKLSVRVVKRSEGDDVAVRTPGPVDKTGSPAVTPNGNPTGSPAITPGGNPTGSPAVTPNGNPTGSPAITPGGNPTGSPAVTPGTTAPGFTEVVYKSESFESGTAGFSGRGGTETITTKPGGVSGNCLSISGRNQSWHGASLNLTDSVVKDADYKISAWFKQNTGTDQVLKVSCTLNSGGEETYPAVGTVVVKSGEWTKFEETYRVPKDFTSLSIYFESSEGTFDFLVDDFSMIQTSEGIAPVDPLTLPSLKETYAGAFEHMGTCLSYNGWRAGNQLLDDSLMSVVCKQFNSFTLEDEMKPEAILKGSKTISTEIAKGSAYNYIIPDNYKEEIVPELNFDTLDKVLQKAYDKGIKMRAHTLLWHQQTANRIFKEDYNDSKGVVSKETMDARVEFYVRTVVSHVLQKEKEITGSAGSIVYAWDITNEYTHRTNDATALWMNVYGDMGLRPSYVKAAYTYAYEELEKENVENKVTLFYNDYNTYLEADNIISLINFINEDKVICKGVGMQSHLDVDYPTVDAYGATIDKFQKAGLEIQITELDVTINCPKGSYNANLKRTDADQADYLYRLMQTILAKKQAGANITGVTFWGLYDTISWRADYSPLLFSSGLNAPKESFYRVIEAAKK